ncbi:MAG TPA: hypothetical protein PKV17_11730 [Aquabacterium sp.]|jgi:hypothetical protein|nr:hypothetical protein [Aquabacterium sp.]HRH29440.1 hypothetical protein [Aquabacterium sp.]
MWKLLLVFVVLAVGVVYLLMQGGDIDMSGEKHGSGASHMEAPQGEGATTS